MALNPPLNAQGACRLPPHLVPVSKPYLQGKHQQGGGQGWPDWQLWVDGQNRRLAAPGRQTDQAPSGVTGSSKQTDKIRGSRDDRPLQADRQNRRDLGDCLTGSCRQKDQARLIPVHALELHNIVCGVLEVRAAQADGRRDRLVARLEGGAEAAGVGVVAVARVLLQVLLHTHLDGHRRCRGFRDGWVCLQLAGWRKLSNLFFHMSPLTSTWQRY